MAENMYSNFDNVLVGITKESTTEGSWGSTTGQAYRYPLYMMVDRIEADRNANTKVAKWRGAGRDPNTSWAGPEFFEVRLEGSLVFDHNFGTTPGENAAYTSSTEFGYQNFISLLGAAMGTVSSTGVCVLRDTLDSFTLEWGNDPILRDQVFTGFTPANEYYNRGTAEYYLAVGCRINTYEFTLNKEGMAKVSLSILCKDISTSNAPQELEYTDLDDIYLPNWRPLDFWDAYPDDAASSTYGFDITFGDGTTYRTRVGEQPEIDEISFMINNNLDPRHALGTSRKIHSLNPRAREITCTLKVERR